MKLDNKVLLIVSAAMAGLIIALYAISSTIVLDGFSRVEEQNTRQNVERFIDALSDDLAELSTTADNWAKWDETYAFIENTNDNYTRSYLYDEEFGILKVNLIFLVNSSGQITYAKSVDLDSMKEMPVSKVALQNLIQQHPETESNFSGIFVFPEGTMLIAGRPILTSAGSGPSRGTLVMGRLMDSREINKLADVTQLSVTAIQLNDPKMPADFQSVSSLFTEGISIIVRPLNEDSIAGYTIVRDINGKPALFLRVYMPRVIFQQGKASLNYYLLSLLAVGMVFGAGMRWLLKKQLISQSLAEESEEKYRTIIENSNDMIWTADLQSRFLFCNRRTEEISGYRVEEWRGKSYLPLVVEKDLPFLTEVFSNVLKGQPQHYEATIKKRDGSTLILSINTAPLYSKGVMIGTVSFGRDITERKKLEALAKKREDQLKEAQRLARLGSWLWDVKADTLTWSDELYDIFGIDKQLPPPNYESLSKHYTPETWALHNKVVNKALESGEPYQEEFEFIRPEGSHGWLIARGEAIRDESGKIIQLYGTAQDITERKNAEIKLAHLLEDLKRSNADLEQFAHMTAHDLQEPLRMVACYVQMLEKRYKGRLDPDADEFIGYAVEGAQRMSKMLNDLLTYSSFDKSVKPLTKTDCGSVLDRVLSELAVNVRESGAKITHDPMPYVLADETQLTHVFRNLIENAIKFRSVAFPNIHIGAKQSGSEWIFSVSDNGIGIEPEYFERIFMISHRLHAPGKYPGTGVGLAICKKIVERHGGRIWVESRPGEGSTFYFTIPIKWGDI